ncbi:MAG: ATP-dependent Clp protease adapter ClpS [Rhizobiaceae bacterium]
MKDVEVLRRPKTRVKTEKPRLYKVLLINDDFTPREFVVRVLKAVFRMTAEQAEHVMLTAHRMGSCVVVVLTKDAAETKAGEATDLGRGAGYPLLFVAEPED